MAAYHFSFYHTTCNISPRIHNPFVSSYLVLHLQMSLPLISTRHLSGPLTGPHRTANMMVTKAHNHSHENSFNNSCARNSCIGRAEYP